MKEKPPHYTLELIFREDTTYVRIRAETVIILELTLGEWSKLIANPKVVVD